ncbi:MAG: TrkH family potassium uptake protein [Clostridia bacterium]|nr:TrkH family potassium uptake protein [Clostridia bacterium]
MNLAVVFYILGKVVLCEGFLLSLPLIVSIIYKEPIGINSFVITIIICVALGLLCLVKKPKSMVFYIKEGFLVTALSWIIISILGCIPFILTGVLTSPVSALFETVSGFTTTGASVITDLDIVPKGVLFWRSLTHWIGGMGVLVFVLMLRAPSGGSDTNLMKAESPGPQVEKLVPKLQMTAKILYSIYFGMTILEVVLLLIGKLPLFDALTLSFGTAGTGGFGITNDSIAGYSSYVQWVIGIFMVLFGVNFSFYFLLLIRKPKKAFSLEEVLVYFSIIAVAVIAIMFDMHDAFPVIWDNLRHAFFQVGSIITTTGYATADFNNWNMFSKTILVLLMFIGACAGSTGGGIKVSRIVIMLRTIKKEIKQFIHPNRVGKVTLNNKPVAHEVVRSVNVFIMAYLFILALSVILISIDGFDFTTNFTAIVSALNNIGPGLEMVGPMGNFAHFSPFSKIVIMFNMLAGRLEIFPLLVLFRRETWRRF